MAALASGVIESILSSSSSSPSTPTAFLHQVSAAAAAFIETSVPARNSQLQVAAVEALRALAPAQEQGHGPFTVITLSLSSTLMAVFRALRAEGPSEQRMRLVGNACLFFCLSVHVSSSPSTHTTHT